MNNHTYARVFFIVIATIAVLGVVLVMLCQLE